MVVTIETSPADLLDRISILEIKQERITDPHKLFNIEKELQALYRTKSVIAKTVPDDVMLDVESILPHLKTVNIAIWDIEEGKRQAERDMVFDDAYIQLARGVQHNNDMRAKYKRDINLLLGSDLLEEKSFI